MTYFKSLSAAGFAATAISYGPARMGFGLYVPEFKSSFGLSTSTVGYISSGGFLGFFVALLVAQYLLNRRGPVWPVVTGLVAATLGLALVALAPNTVILAIGVSCAAASAGFAWTPFNDAVHRKVYDRDRPTALSAISTGTSVGIAAAGATLLLPVFTGLSWRYCWGFFTIAAFVTLLANWRALGKVEKSTEDGPDGGWRNLIQPRATALLAIALVFGVTSAIFISFAADHAREAMRGGSLPAVAMPALLFISYGVCGLAGLLTGRLRGRLGLPRLLRLLMLAGATSCGLLALVPGSPYGLALAAGLQGVHVMMTSAVLAFWTERLFPALPSLSFTAALLAMAAGSIVGPAIAGISSDALGGGVMFAGTALLPLAAALLLRDRFVSEKAMVP